METPYDVAPGGRRAFSGSRPLPLRLPACLPFIPVFTLAGLDRLPLHVRRRVRSAGTKRNDVVDDVFRTGPADFARGRARILHAEIPFGTVTPVFGSVGRYRRQRDEGRDDAGQNCFRTHVKLRFPRFGGPDAGVSGWRPRRPDGHPVRRPSQTAPNTGKGPLPSGASLSFSSRRTRTNRYGRGLRPGFGFSP